MYLLNDVLINEVLLLYDMLIFEWFKIIINVKKNKFGVLYKMFVVWLIYLVL